MPKAAAVPGDIMPGAEVARQLDIYLGQLYGWEKKGLNIHQPQPPNATSKSKTWVSLSEAQALAGNIKHKAARSHTADGQPVAKGPRARAPKSSKIERRAKVKAGDIISWDRGRAVDGETKGHSIASVTGTPGRLINLEGMPHGNGHDYVFTSESLASRMAKGIVKLETPESVLGMVLLQWMRDEKDDLAVSLSKWLDDNGVDPIIPELIETPADEVAYTDEAEVVAEEEEE